MPKVLLLGGTTEASKLARILADAGVDATFSYAGRTEAPVIQPLPVRVGGFGGVEGLAAYMHKEGITHLLDATHPFAAQISANAVKACTETGVRLLAVQRPAWRAGPGDEWAEVADFHTAALALPVTGARVFLAIGRQNLDAFAGRANHYLLRLVDPPEQPPLPDCTIVIARGPFDAGADRDLMVRHRITHLVAKNSGGAGAAAKLVAARDLGLPVVMIQRPVLPAREVTDDPAKVLQWLSHDARRGV